MFGRLGVLGSIGSLGAKGGGVSDDTAVDVSARASLAGLSNTTALTGFGSVAAVSIEMDPAAEFGAVSAVTVSPALAGYVAAPAISNIFAATATPQAGYTATVGISNIAATSIERSTGYTWANSEGSDWEAQADTTGWDDAFRGDVDQLISDLKSGTVNATNTYSGFDRILLMDTPNSSDSLRYLNAPTVTATAVNSPTFTATEGFTGNGSTSYVNSNFTPSTDGSQYTQNSASLGVWVRTAETSICEYFGVSDSPAFDTLRETGSGIILNGPNGGSAETSAPTESVGLFAGNRSAVSASQAYWNGANAGSDATTSVAPAGSNVFVLARNTAGSPSQFCEGQVSIFFAGRSFTANEWADIHDAFNTYRTAREAA